MRVDLRSVVKSRASWRAALVLTIVLAATSASCSLWPGWPSDLYVVSFRKPTTFADALGFARATEIDVTHILFHHDKPTAGHGGIRAPNGSDTDPSDMDAEMASVTGQLIQQFEESKEREGSSWNEVNERQLQDLKEAIHCATGLQAHVDGGRELRSVRDDPNVASVTRLMPWSVVASGEPSPEDFEDCVNATRKALSGVSTAAAPQPVLSATPDAGGDRFLRAGN